MEIWRDFKDLDYMEDTNILINCTPLGTYPHENDDYPIYLQESDIVINNNYEIESAINEVLSVYEKILIINGSNINLLGLREPEIYGFEIYDDLCKMIEDYAMILGISVEIYQSNHEGKIIDKIQATYGKYE